MSLLNTDLPHAKMKEYDWYTFLFYERHFKEVDKVLDVGCGVGNFIAIDPKKIVGVDIDEKAIKICKERGFNATLDRKFSSSYCGLFDGVHCGATLEHVHNPVEFMKSLYAVLKPGGKLVLLTPDILRWGFDFWGVAYHWEGHPFSKKSLLALAHDTGFKNIKIENGYLSVPFPFGIKLQNLLGVFKRTRNIVMVCYK